MGGDEGWADKPSKRQDQDKTRSARAIVPDILKSNKPKGKHSVDRHSRLKAEGSTCTAVAIPNPAIPSMGEECRQVFNNFLCSPTMIGARYNLL